MIVIITVFILLTTLTNFNMEKLTPSCLLLLNSLWYKHTYFSKKNMLSQDGSFYYDDKRLSFELKISMRTIVRVKQFLVKEGYISITPGKYKSNATKYWVLKRPDKMAPFVDISKPDKMSVKDDKMTVKACQNVTINNINNKVTNNNIYNIPFEELKEGLKGSIKVSGKETTRKRYVDLGYSEDIVNNIIKELIDSNSINSNVLLEPVITG